MPNTGDYQKQKLELEIQILEKKLEDLRQEKQTSPFKKTGTFLKDFLPSLLVFFSITGAVITIWIQSNNYIDEKRKENEIRVDEQMISLMNQLENDTMAFKERDKKMMLLTQYNRNAIPVLLLYLRYNHTNDHFFVVMESLRTIRQKIDDDVFINDIINYTDNLFRRMIDLKFSEQETSIGLQWHVKMLYAFAEKSDEKKINNFLQKWKEKLDQFKDKDENNCDGDCTKRVEDIIAEINASDNKQQYHE